MSVYRNKRTGKWVAKTWHKGAWRYHGTAHPTRKAAREAEQAALKQRITREITVSNFAKVWQRDYARPAAASRRTYRYGLNALLAEFGNRRLDAIDRPEARAWAIRQSEMAVRTARTMYGDALRDGLVELNPFAALRLKRSRGRKDITALTEEEIDALAHTALEVLDPEMGPQLSALILVAGYCGLRPGELFELRWGDLNADEMTVARSLDVTGAVKPPKNGEPRTIIIPPKARAALVSLPRSIDSDLIFTTARGKRFRKTSLHYWFSQVRAAAGRPQMDFYELRHACAHLLLMRGATPEDIAVQLGHKDGGTLVRTLYGHPSEEAARGRLKRMFAEPVELSEVKKRRAS